MAATNDAASDGNTAASFSGIWTMFLIMAIAGGGTAVMRRSKSKLLIGFLIGVTCMFTELSFVLCVLFISYHNDAGGNEIGSDGAMAAFSFFQFIAFGLFSVVLFCYRDHVIDTSLASLDNAKATVPPSTSAAASPGAVRSTASADAQAYSA